MSDDSGPAAARERAVRFARLLPPGPPADVHEIAEGLDFAARAQARAREARERPYLLLNMVSTLDGRASIGGRSGPIGNRADRELFHALRARADAVIAGAGTVRAERYGRMIRSEQVRRARGEQGLRPEPIAGIVSGRLALPADTPLLGEPESHVVILTSSEASLPETGAQIDYVRAGTEGELDLALAMRELRSRFGVQTAVCEGGPHLNARLLLAGLVDELFVTLAPKLAGGEDATGEALRIVAGAAFEEPLGLELLGALENDSNLFLRYGVRGQAAPARG